MQASKPQVLSREAPPGHRVYQIDGLGWVCCPTQAQPGQQPLHATYDAAVSHAWWRYRANESKARSLGRQAP